ncbi:hypothetical protein [Botrimarina colliarenosi]|nr:hypothetical protein [Botrimarina colliarenosi]
MLVLLLLATIAAPALAIDTVAPARYEIAPESPADVAPLEPTPKALPSSQPQPNQPQPSKTPATFEQRLIALEIALSTIVVERPTLWRFDRLGDEAADLLTVATDDAQRRAVRDVAARIDSFRRLGTRMRDSDPPATQMAVSDRSGVATTTPATNPTAVGWRSPSELIGQAPNNLAPPSAQLASAPVGDRQDAQGVLRPVVSQRPDAPKYAVIDDQGKIAALVTPTPELDARFKSLVGQRVGLQGRRGYRTDLRREHLVAERVTPLDTLRR